ncbi:hypothetical protein VTP01DRAFT_3655 [Rhizomucor pusillus]|uniref:uncharacterized protein n=1 Tax=Rhizomucor pusillus TaxID=4840 RepID=UPI00374435A0
MEISTVDVLAWLHSSKENESNTEATSRIAFDPRIAEPALVIENEGGTINESYRFSRIPFQDLNDCSPEIENAVKFAVEGYNACVVLLSAGAADAFETRRDTLRKVLYELSRQLVLSNEIREKRQLPMLRLEYAYIGITDDYCYDLRKGSRLDNAYLLEHGIDSLMKAAKNIEAIWDKTKAGCKYPFTLKIRLTDGDGYAGSLILADLLFPWCTVPRAGIPPSLKRSFAALSDLVRKRSNSNYIGSVCTENCVLTKILGSSFIGLSKLTIFMYLDEYPGDYSKEMEDALVFSQQLQQIRTVLVRNAPDPRLLDYKAQNSALREELKKQKEKTTSCIRDVAEINSKFESLLEERDFQRQLLQKSAQENRKLRNQCDLIQAITEYNTSQNRLEQCVLKSRNYELRLSRIRMDRKNEHALARLIRLESQINDLNHKLAAAQTDAIEQVQRLKEQLEICGEQLRQKEASLRDAWRDLARRKADTTVEEDNKKLKEDMESLLRIIHILEDEKEKSVRMINNLADKAGRLEEERSRWKQLAEERKTDILECMDGFNNAEFKIKEYETEIEKLKNKLKEYEGISSRPVYEAAKATENDEAGDANEDQDRNSDEGRKSVPSGQEITKTIHEKDKQDAQSKVPKKRARRRKAKETPIVSDEPDFDGAASETQDTRPADATNAISVDNVATPDDTEAQAGNTETAAPPAIKKRRRLLDPKRRVQEYDDPLSPLSKVHQVLQDDT